MYTGLSLSFCVRDIVKGLVPLNQVDKIITATMARPDEWDGIIAGYKKLYWSEKPDKCERVARQLIKNGKVDQPRMRDEEPQNIADGHWLVDGKQVRNLDCRTHLYYYHTNPIIVGEVLPNSVGFDEKLWTKGEPAKEIYNNADYFCVNVMYGEDYRTHSGYNPKHKFRWSVHIPGQPSTKWFKVWRTHGNTEQDYKNLIKKLERRAHKKGLTVLVT